MTMTSPLHRSAIPFLSLVAAALLGGCTVKTTVQVTATTPANVSHLYVTVKEIWFAEHAGTSSSGKWKKKELSKPITIDLATLNNGTTTDLGSIDLGAGDYAQVRLVLADVDAPLAKSAEDLNLAWNSAVQYVDNGLSRLVPLELASPSAALLVPAVIDIEGNTVLDALGAEGDAEATVVVDIDVLRGLALLDSGNSQRMLLDPVLAAHNDADAGTISGTFDLTTVPASAISSSQSIVVSAEQVGAGGAVRRVVKNVRLSSGGAFTLYPLWADDTGDISYDVVLHGVGVSPVIVTGVTLKAGKTRTLQGSAISVPLSPGFRVNTGSAVPGGTRAGFYQQLPGDPAPFLIETAAVHPLLGGFASDLSLSPAALAYGAWNDGEVISFSLAAPVEGAATYRLAADASWRARSDFVTFTDAASGPGTAQDIALPQPVLPSAATPGSISGSIQFTAPDQFDALQLIVSRGGQLVETVDLSAALPGMGSIDFMVTDLPAGVPTAVYEVSVRAWHSSDAAATLVRALFMPEADLRQGDANGLSLQL